VSGFVGSTARYGSDDGIEQGRAFHADNYVGRRLHAAATPSRYADAGRIETLLTGIGYLKPGRLLQEHEPILEMVQAIPAGWVSP
jgi:hypothetical protein